MFLLCIVTLLAVVATGFGVGLLAFLPRLLWEAQSASIKESGWLRYVVARTLWVAVLATVVAAALGAYISSKHPGTDTLLGWILG
jgi:hypothetical protein